MTEIICLIGENNEGEWWYEKICSDKNEGLIDIEFLKNRSISIPEIDSKFFIDLGLSFRERDVIINKIIEFKKNLDLDRPEYKIEYEYLHEENQKFYDDFDKDKLTIKVIEVSELNYSNQYIHTVVKFEEASIGEDYSEVYKISLPQKSPIGTIDTISMKDFIIIGRKKGYQHPKSLKKIENDEKWLFIRRANE
jgi:hypothetical protein